MAVYSAKICSLSEIYCGRVVVYLKKVAIGTINVLEKVGKRLSPHIGSPCVKSTSEVLICIYLYLF